MLRVVFLGHKDHGKSTLIGRLLFDLGTVNPDKLEPIKTLAGEQGKQFEFAHFLDSFREERKQEMTMDTTHAHLTIKGQSYELIDVPGHEALIRHMLTGAGDAEAAILVVSATAGLEAQTFQHISLARFLGIKHVAVAINKLDQYGFRRDVFARLRNRILRTLQTYGISNATPVIPIAARDGVNLAHRSSKSSWYKGPTILDFLKNYPPDAHTRNQSFVLPVQDVVSNQPQKILLGKVEHGFIRRGQQVFILPVGRWSSVQAIYTAGGAPLAMARPNTNVGVSLSSGIHKVSRGTVLTADSRTLKLATRISLKAVLIRKLARSRLTIQCGTAKQPANIAFRSPLLIGEPIDVHLTLARPLVVSHPGEGLSLGRVVLLEGGTIVGIGRIKLP